MGILYAIGIRLYSAIIHIAALFNPKAKKWVAGRKHLLHNLPNVNHKSVMWFHCASLGEFDQGLPVMNRLKEQNPDIFLLVTFFSPSGLDHYNKREHKVDFACYLPIDIQSNAKKFIAHFKPQQAFFVKYEIWVNYILELKRMNAQIFGVCSIFRSNHRFFKWYGGHFRHALQQFDHFFVQNKQSQNLLESINLTNSTVVGDTRFDRLLANKTKVLPNARIEQFLRGDTCILIGSSWPKDEDLLLPFIKRHRDTKFIIAPHQIDDKHVHTIQNQLGVPSQLYTENPNTSNVLILNTIGHLTSAYQYGKWAYIGGGFSGKLHNILEPAVFGLPVVFGPKHDRFPEAQQFISAGHAFSVSSQDELEATYSHLQNNHSSLKSKALQTVSDNSGATSKIMEKLNQMFPLT